MSPAGTTVGAGVSVADLVEVLSAVAREVEDAGVPRVAGVHAYMTYRSDEGVHLVVEVHALTAVDVDEVAEWWGLPADDGTSRNYTRYGMVTTGGVRHALCGFSGRPAVPARAGVAA